MQVTKIKDEAAIVESSRFIISVFVSALLFDWSGMVTVGRKVWRQLFLGSTTFQSETVGCGLKGGFFKRIQHKYISPVGGSHKLKKNFLSTLADWVVCCRISRKLTAVSGIAQLKCSPKRKKVVLLLFSEFSWLARQCLHQIIKVMKSVF